MTEFGENVNEAWNLRGFQAEFLGGKICEKNKKKFWVKKNVRNFSQNFGGNENVSIFSQNLGVRKCKHFQPKFGAESKFERSQTNFGGSKLLGSILT